MAQAKERIVDGSASRRATFGSDKAYGGCGQVRPGRQREAFCWPRRVRLHSRFCGALGPAPGAAVATTYKVDDAAALAE